MKAASKTRGKQLSMLVYACATECNHRTTVPKFSNWLVSRTDKTVDNVARDCYELRTDTRTRITQSDNKGRLQQSPVNNMTVAPLGQYSGELWDTCIKPQTLSYNINTKSKTMKTKSCKQFKTQVFRSPSLENSRCTRIYSFLNFLNASKLLRQKIKKVS